MIARLKSKSTHQEIFWWVLEYPGKGYATDPFGKLLVYQNEKLAQLKIDAGGWYESAVAKPVRIIPCQKDD